MRNVDRAAVVIFDTAADDHSAVIAEALDDAGLIMPDLPEVVENKDGSHSVYLPPTFAEVWWDGELGTDRVEKFLNWHATPERFRAVAYALLAIANHAEGVES